MSESPRIGNSFSKVSMADESVVSPSVFSPGSRRCDQSQYSEESWNAECSDEVADLLSRVEKKDERILELLNIIDELETHVETLPASGSTLAEKEEELEKRPSRKRLTRKSMIEWNKHRASAVADTSIELECLERDLDDALRQNQDITLRMLELQDKEEELRILLTEEMNNFEAKDNECEMIRLEMDKLRPELKRKDKTIAVLNNQVDVLEEELQKLGHLADTFAGSACFSPAKDMLSANFNVDGDETPAATEQNLEEERNRWAKHVHELTSLVEAQKEAMRLSALKVTAMWRNNLRLTQVEPDTKQSAQVFRVARRKTVNDGQIPSISENEIPADLRPLPPLTVNVTMDASPMSMREDESMNSSPQAKKSENTIVSDEDIATVCTSPNPEAVSSTGNIALFQEPTEKRPTLASAARQLRERHQSWSTGLVDRQLHPTMSFRTDGTRSVCLSQAGYNSENTRSASQMRALKRLPTVEELRVQVMKTKRKLSERQNGAKFKREGSPRCEVDLDKLLNERLAMRRDYEQDLANASASSQTPILSQKISTPAPPEVKPDPVVEKTTVEPVSKAQNRVVKMKIRVDTICQVCRSKFLATGTPDSHLQPPPGPFTIRQPRLVSAQSVQQQNARPLFNIPIANPTKVVFHTGDSSPVPI
eukprot:GEMP01015797.1.p1 GENE.GEMP01015797.1~~GEMP01015797.1.p1  ORF type:complete len:653 (+),score=138.46 GEMP01015797.1:321-2279(+)